MKKEFKEAIEDSPIIAAIKDDDGLQYSRYCRNGKIFQENRNGSY